MKLDAQVYDRWWPWRLGRIQWVGKTRVHVVWRNGVVQAYDRAHYKFLQVVQTE